MKLLLNFTEAGEELGVDRRTVSEWVKAGKLRTVTPNGRPYIPRAQLDELTASFDGAAA